MSVQLQYIIWVLCLCWNRVIASSHLCLLSVKIFSLKTPACDRQRSSYRSTFTIRPGQWATVRLPWDSFDGSGPGDATTAPFVPTLRRLGVVSIGEEKDVVLAVGRVGFYNVI